MREITVDDLKADPEKWVEVAEAGETLVILHGGKPIALMKPIEADPPASA